MPHFRTVEVYPMSGWWCTRWHECDEDGDAFAKVSRGICDAYSDALSADAPQHTVSTLRIFIDNAGRRVPELPDPPDRRQTVVVSPTFTDRVWEGFEQAAVLVPPGFARLALDRQRRIVLDAVHAAARGLATFRGLEQAALERARQAVLDAGYVFTWSSAWKSSPGRRWRARCVFRTKPDGFGRLTLEVTDADGSMSAASPEQVAFTTVEGYRRAGKTLRWTAVDRLEVVPYVDFLGVDTGDYVITVDGGADAGLRLRELQLPALPRPRHAAAQDASQPSAPEGTSPSDGVGDEPLETVSLIVPDPTRREIFAVGGGPINDVPERYWRTLHALFGQLHGAEWQAWWAPAAVPTLQISWRGGVTEDRLFVRRGKDKVIARIERTPAGLRDGDPVPAARDDLSNLLAIVQQRMELATPPRLS